MKIARFVRVLLTAACLLLALPALASAATYTVNSIGDQPDDDPGVGGCATALANCTLRAAVEESNASTSADDTILFSALFNGMGSGTIVSGLTFPPITDEVTIDGDAGGAGGQCTTEAGAKGPCVGMRALDGFEVQAPSVTIQGIAISDAPTAIVVEADGFQAQDNWIGVELDGTTGSAKSNFGIALEPGSEDAQIGGTTAPERNVFGDNTVGLRLRGTQDSVVEGNYFGTGPDGSTPFLNTRNLVVADPAVGVAATGNTIGAEVGAAGAATAACDLGCNVFVSSSTTSVYSIDLHGLVAFEEKPATGPTTILGNYIGLDATGAAATEAAESAIRVGSASEVRIGGLDPGDGNQIHGGSYAVFASKDGVPAKKLRVLGNMIGRALDNSGPLFPSGDGINLSSAGITDEADMAQIEGNYITADGSAVDSHSTGAVIADNHIYEGFRGIWTHGDTEGSGIGNEIEGNTISDAPTGVYIQNDLNELTGNTITDCETGVAIENFLSLDSSDNLIGGDGDGEGNLISGSEFNAIEIIDVEGSQNEIGRNSGSGNGGKFIRLRAADPGTEPVGPNGGIKPPAVAAASKTEASGTAVAGATVRVFAKAGTSAGELGAYLGQSTADSGGDWQLTYLSPVAGGTFVAATQTNEDGGTSELSAVASVPADPSGGGGGSGGGGSGGGGVGGGGVIVCKPSIKAPCPGGPDRTAPQTQILKGPRGKVAKSTVKFKFSSSEKGSTFRCKLDRKPYRVCKSPKKYKNLKPGKHVFKVRAVDKAGNIDPSAAKRKFTILG